VQTLQELGVPVETMADPVGGFAFEYPAGWIVTAPSDEDKKNAYIYAITLRSAVITPGPKQQEGLPEGMTAVDINVTYQGGPKTLAQAVDERRAAITQSETGRPIQILADEAWNLPGGLPAHRFLMNIGPVSAAAPGLDRLASEAVTLVNGKMVLIAGQGDLALVDAIAASLRAIQ